MSDIVARLRILPDAPPSQNRERLEAATEIERLRGEVQALKHQQDAASEAIKECERLRAALADMVGIRPSRMFAYISGQSEGKIAELEAREEYALGHLGSQIKENEKLRAELAATIERCAQVADDFEEHPGPLIAARIRAKKDKG